MIAVAHYPLHTMRGRTPGAVAQPDRWCYSATRFGGLATSDVEAIARHVEAFPAAALAAFRKCAHPFDVDFLPPLTCITIGRTMTRALLLCAILLAARAEASQDWELISVTRGPTWEVNQASGALKQKGKVLEGVLKDRTDGQADYQIRIELDGGHAKASFRFISEQDSGATLTGAYSKVAKPTKTHCPEQIQLMNAFQYIGLARDACEP